MSNPIIVKSATKLHLGPGGVAYAMALVVVVVLAMYTQANLLFIAFGIMVGALLVSFFWSWRTLRKLHIERLSPSYGVVDDRVVLRYSLTNNSFLPIFNLTISESWGKGLYGWKKTGPLSKNETQRLNGRSYGWVMHIGPRQVMQVEAPLWPTHRGYLHLEKILVTSSFPFGLINKTVFVEQEDDLLVFPKLHHMRNRVIARLSRNEPMGEKQLQRGGGQEEFFALREYRPGDSLKMIDWKHSARTGETIAREMTLPGPPKLMVLLDIRNWGNDRGANIVNPEDGTKKKISTSDLQERAIVIAASLICDSHDKGYKVGLGISGTSNSIFPANNNLPHIITLLTALAEIDLDNITSNSAPFTEAPSVEIHLKEGADSFIEGFRHVLLATNMEQYLTAPRSALQVLNTRSHMRSRRELIHEKLKPSV